MLTLENGIYFCNPFPRLPVKTLQAPILLERWRHFHDCPHFPAQQNMTELWISHSAISGDIQLSYSRDFSRFYYRTPTLEALLGLAICSSNPNLGQGYIVLFESGKTYVFSPSYFGRKFFSLFCKSGSPFWTECL